MKTIMWIDRVPTEADWITLGVDTMDHYTSSCHCMYIMNTYGRPNWWTGKTKGSKARDKFSYRIRQGYKQVPDVHPLNRKVGGI